MPFTAANPPNTSAPGGGNAPWSFTPPEYRGATAQGAYALIVGVLMLALFSAAGAVCHHLLAAIAPIAPIVSGV